MLKFVAFEAIITALPFHAISQSLRCVASGCLFCPMMLSVTIYRFGSV